MFCKQFVLSIKNAKNIFIITGLGGGGAEKNLLEWVAISKKAGGAMVIYVSPRHFYAKAIRDLDVEVFYLPLQFRITLLRSIFMIFLLLPALLRAQHNLFGWLYHGQFLTGMIKLLSFKKPKLFWCVRSSLQNYQGRSTVSKLIFSISARFSSLVDIMISNSNTAQRLHLEAGFNPIRSLVVPNFRKDKGVSDFVNPTYSRFLIWKSRFSNVFCFVGRDHPDKGLDIYLDIAASILESKQNNDYGFLVLGEVNINRISKINDAYPGHFFVPGFQEEPELWIKKCDCLLLTSRTESFPNVVIEAMLVRTFVVAFDVGDVKSLLTHSEFVVNAGEVNEFLLVVDKYLDLSNYQRNKIIYANLQRATQVCDYGYWSKIIVDIYNRNIFL